MSGRRNVVSKADAASIRVVCCQLAPAVGAVDANVALCEAAIADALGRGADVIVLP